MEINLKKWFIVFALLIAGVVYIHGHYTFEDVLTYSKKNPDPDLSPRLDYYVGFASYLRSDYPLSARAFEQLLADYPTSYYTPNALFRLGAVYSERNQWQNARDVYQRYMDEYPNGDHIEAVKNKYEYIKFR